MTQKITDDEIRSLVIERLKSISDESSLMIGGDKKLSKSDMIKSVQNGDDTGKKIIDMQMTYLRDLASGKLMENIMSL
ncbi:MAG: hypothetical protein UX08_C0002G0011 [Candidatus Collierbacteria bacterium GW2011_GWB1_45_35]|uniref:Uncharacterized protein n=2 Tax=Candidatus Collieribacteriota TaxID=1752725 RepID=A0A0G1NP51_9BACT|nr:MAG: hypothetical protein UW48_C0004G0021 [Microgenomates group bacterium GW2011_GWC1_44_23]KKT85989.1 MAG: hypothetical protein UW84_C0018G0013 [Candidatus Collierbacteria bacterium GW2011_GWA2_44_99]KKT95697.1 MAG: hypothetical protein UW96_C0005G0021 [Candidatus Collierbacteria bacterium GW2011_GWA1_45_15]KKU00344.1 MAG: hypothetical protein UX01_C0005G0021 [Candidatus Collierbacteria bacterium GW2011_GWB2_45_17]KKU05796.1 MAG: hypothetical protein UX08_C0002G0011 [Candidatus Collierbacte